MGGMTINEILDKLNGRRVVVIGDAMVDVWHRAEHGRTTNEMGDDRPIYKASSSRREAGGAANVAVSLARLGCRVSLIAMRGDDADGQWLHDCLAKETVHAYWLMSSRTTTVKERLYWSNATGGYRFDSENAHPASDSETAAIWHCIRRATENEPDAVAVCDYGKGMVNEGTICFIRSIADAPILVDTRGGDLSKYDGATVLKPNVLQLHLNGRSITAVLKGLAKFHEATVVGTSGPDGLIVAHISGNDWRVPAVRVERDKMHDAIGAGDMILSGLTAATAGQVPFDVACEFATLTASISVRYEGTHAVGKPDFIQYKDRVLHGHREQRQQVPA